MNSNTANERNRKRPSREQEIDLLGLAGKVWSSRRLILKSCAIGAVIGIVIATGTPEVYTAGTLVASEGTRKRTSSSVSALADMAGGMKSSIATERDALYPSLYPSIVNSTPFLVGLFDVKVHKQKNSAAMTLAQYLKGHQKAPWWSTITSAPFKLAGWGMSLLSSPADEPEEGKTGTKERTVPLRLTREEAGMAGAIASCISIEVDKKKRTIAIGVTMQDPQVAAIVTDTVRVRLEEYMTEYRTSKARRILEYSQKLREEAQAEYYAAQDRYTRYADANQSLASLASRAESARLRNEMELASTTYNQMEIQVKAAEARVNKVTPVYTVIQPAAVPLGPSKPHKMLIITGCVFLAGMAGAGWSLFVRDIVKRIRKKECCLPADGSL